MALGPPILQWDFREGSGTTANDRAPGTAQNVTLTPGASGAWDTSGGANKTGYNFAGTATGITPTLTSTKVQTAFAGATTATIEFVIDSAASSSTYDEYFKLQDGSGNGIIGITVNHAQGGLLFSAGEGNSPNDCSIRYAIATSGIIVGHITINTGTATATDRPKVYIAGSRVTPTVVDQVGLNVLLDQGVNWSTVKAYFGEAGAIIGGKVRYLAIYAGEGTAAEIASNAANLANNDDADPNVVAAVDGWISRFRAKPPIRFRGPGRSFVQWPVPSQSVASLTLALTGVSATGSVGSVGLGASLSLTGNAATGSVGTLAPGTDMPLTGVTATGSVGTVTASGGGDVTVALTGVSATGSVGSVGAGTAAALTGVASTSAVGTMGAPRSLPLTGVAANTGVGSITTSGGTLTGATALSRWKVDETSGTTLADSIGSNALTLGSGYTLNVTPPAVLTSSTGAIRGTTACIAARAGLGSSLPNGTAAQSWSLWIKAVSNAGTQGIFSLTNSGITAGAGLFLNAGSLLMLEYNGAVTLVSATAPSTGNWHHVAWTYDGAGGHLLYVDGTQVGSATATPSASTTADILLTTSDSGTTNPFAGDIDDVRVFSGVLTPTQITRMAAGGEPNDATVALTGVSATGSVGSVGPGRSLAVSGVASAAGVGSVGFSAALALSGAAATGSVGSVGPGAAPALTGVSATGSVGTVGPSRSVSLTGVAATAAVGTISVNGNLTIALTGVVATGIAGTIATARAMALAGVAAAGAVGSVGMNLVRALTGVSATGRVGNTGPPIPVTQVYPPFVAVVDSQQLTVDVAADTLSVTGDT